MTPPLAPWLTVIGIGEDGPEGLTPAARALLQGAKTLIGGARNLALVEGEAPKAERIFWTDLPETLQEVLRRRGAPTVVLASGDPMMYGFGATLTRHFNNGEMTVIPHVSAFTLAALRMGWPLQDAMCLTAHGRPLADIGLHVHNGARLLILSHDGTTPAKMAALLVAQGFSRSEITVLEHMGGPKENLRTGVAGDWAHETCADLNTLAVECIGDRGSRDLSRVPGLPDDAFQHDGQLTKREVRAVTLSTLAPMPGELLWDVGAGSGSISIEWMRAAPGARAVAFERHQERIDMMMRNAANLGVPSLIASHGEALTAMRGKTAEKPHAIFVGGGISGRGDLLQTCWDYLRRDGRLVANAVTVETEAKLVAFRAKHGGTLTRHQISRLKSVGGLHGWESLPPITQYHGVKP